MDLLPWLFLLLVTTMADGYPRAEGQPSIPRSVVKFPNSTPSQYHRWPINSSALRPREGQINTTRAGDGGFVFPTEQPLLEDAVSQRIQSCSDGGKFCETAPDYPEGLLEGMLGKVATEYRALFGNDLVEGDLRHRINSPNENPLCESFVHIVYPKKAEDKDGQIKYVVNMGEYKQGVRVETCVTKDNKEPPCEFTELVPFGYKTFCKQKYIYRKLLALNEGNLEVIQFPLPSCCMCMVKVSMNNLRVDSSGIRQVIGKNRINESSSSVPDNLKVTSNDTAKMTQISIPDPSKKDSITTIVPTANESSSIP